jgi:hypothetical protein
MKNLSLCHVGFAVHREHEHPPFLDERKARAALTELAV